MTVHVATIGNGRANCTCGTSIVDIVNDLVSWADIHQAKHAADGDRCKIRYAPAIGGRAS